MIHTTQQKGMAISKQNLIAVQWRENKGLRFSLAELVISLNKISILSRDRKIIQDVYILTTMSNMQLKLTRYKK